MDKKKLKEGIDPKKIKNAALAEERFDARVTPARPNIIVTAKVLRFLGITAEEPGHTWVYIEDDEHNRVVCLVKV